MANAIYDPRIEPHQFACVVDDESRARLGRMEAVEGMTSTLGNRIVSIGADGLKMERAAVESTRASATRKHTADCERALSSITGPAVEVDLDPASVPVNLRTGLSPTLP